MCFFCTVSWHCRNVVTAYHRGFILCCTFCDPCSHCALGLYCLNALPVCTLCVLAKCFQCVHYLFTDHALGTAHRLGYMSCPFCLQWQFLVIALRSHHLPVATPLGNERTRTRTKTRTHAQLRKKCKHLFSDSSLVFVLNVYPTHFS